MALRAAVDSSAGGTLVASVTGTANQVTASPTTGAVIVGLAAVAQIGTSLAIGGATIGTDALGVTGTMSVSGVGKFAGGVAIGTATTALGQGVAAQGSTTTISSGTTNATVRVGDNSGNIYVNLTTGLSVLGGTDAAIPTAQTLRVQSVVAGTAAANGANWTLIGSLPTGTGTSGDIIIQTGVKTGSGTTQGTPTTALTIKGETQAITIASGKALVLGNNATTGLGAGILAALTNASIVISDGTTQAYRIPCII